MWIVQEKVTEKQSSFASQKMVSCGRGGVARVSLLHLSDAGLWRGEEVGMQSPSFAGMPRFETSTASALWIFFHVL